MRLSESPSTRSDINSASRAIRVSRQGTGWDAGEDGIQTWDDISEGEKKNLCLLKAMEGGCLEACGSSGEAHYCNILTSNTNQQEMLSDSN